MNAKAMCLGGALFAGALLLWSCDSDSTGGLKSPCSFDGECGSGLICAVGRCSNRSAGSQCDQDDQCNDGLICNGTTCGGFAGDRCLRGDASCIEGLICALMINGDPACTDPGVPRGIADSPCGTGGHCNSGRCNEGLCTMAGSLASKCGNGIVCIGDYVCINNVCNNKSELGGSCSNDDNHCVPSLVCDINTCRRPEGTGCSDDSQCAGDLICAGTLFPVCAVRGDREERAGCSDDRQCAGDLVCNGAPGYKTCGLAGGGSRGNVCGTNSHCTEEGLSCVLGLCSNRRTGSRCGFDFHCADSLVCGDDGICGSAVRSMCATDDDCAGSLICAGSTVGALTCAQSNGRLGDACRRTADHCVDGLVCSGSSVCRIARDGVCGADGDCTDSLLCQFRQDGGQERVCTQVGIGVVGSVCRRDIECNNINDGICIGDTGRQVCAQMGNGETGTVCSADNHCDSGHICHDYVCTVDSTIWVSKESNVDGELRDVHYANGLWVAAGGTADSGETTDSGEPIGRGDITTSAYGTVWTGQMGVDDEGKLNAVDYGMLKWITVGTSGKIISSANGTTWASTTAPGGLDVVLNDVTYNGRWIAVGSASNNDMPPSRVGYIAGSGIFNSWLPLEHTQANPLHAVLSNGRHSGPPVPWVAVGASGLIATSTNGTNSDNNPLAAGVIWHAQTSGVTSNLVDGFFGNRLWVAASDKGDIITSGNGTTWAAQTITDSEITDIHYANGRWVAVGTDTSNNNGLVVTSPDGTTWTKRTSNATSTLNAVHYDNTLWVAVGNGGVVVTSTNGTTWAAQRSNVTSNLTDVHYATSRWVAVGADGAITTSRAR